MKFSEKKYSDITQELNGTVLSIILNRPQRLNSITPTMVDEITDLLNAAETDEGVRIVLIKGSGGNFSSGADISAFRDLGGMSALNFHRKLNSLALKFRSYPKPVIAVMRGYALGGGLELAQSADIRIASESCRLGQPEINIGVNAGAGGNVILPRLIGRGRALHMILTGEKITAQKAYEIGLVDLVFPDDELDDEVNRIAETISEKPQDTVYLSKMAVNFGSEVNITSALEYEATAFGLLFTTPDTRKKVGEFLSRKK